MTSKRAALTISVLAASWLMAPYAVAVQTQETAIEAAPVADVFVPASLPEVPAAIVEVAPVEAAVPSNAPAAAIVEPEPVAPAAEKSSQPLVVESAEVFIDRDDYSIGATEREAVTVEIITRNQPATKPQNTQSVPTTIAHQGRPRVNSVQIGAVNLSSAGIGFQPQAPSASSIVSPGRSYLDQKFLQPLGTATQGLLKVMFPLAIPAPVTSLFGWRIHPISGTQRLHTGTDIGAPMGTPIMASLPGRVILADEMGGYGITVAIEHDNGVRQTLYAHMSEIFVRPGDVVQQGTVIGRVGSTGASTGPHLHFELRQMMPDGTWIALDAGKQLENSMGNLIRSLQIAQQPKTTAIRPNTGESN